jgi:hypothetical protein
MGNRACRDLIAFGCACLMCYADPCKIPCEVKLTATQHGNSQLGHEKAFRKQHSRLAPMSAFSSYADPDIRYLAGQHHHPRFS